MVPVPKTAQQAHRFRALLRVLLGLLAFPADVDVLVGTLFATMYQLEERCPSLCCHFHMPGVSAATGKSFFVILYDAASAVHDGVKRVIQTVYTHLHAQLSMTTTAAIIRRSLCKSPEAEPGVPADRIASAAIPAATAPSAAVAEGDLPATGGSDSGVEWKEPPEKDGGARPRNSCAPSPEAVSAPPSTDDHPTPAAPLPAADAILLTATAPTPTPDPTSTFFEKPDVYFSSDAAIWCMEALFTVSVKGWVEPVRDIMKVVRTALLHKYGTSCRAFIQGKLPWWPVDVRNTIESDDLGGTPKCMHFPYPVAVQRRHLPTGERTRNADDVEEAMVTLTEIGTTKTPDFHLIVAVLLLLFDKEVSVRVAILDRMETFGIKIDPSISMVPDETMAGVTMDDPLLTDSLGLAAGTPPPSSPPSSPPATPSTGFSRGADGSKTDGPSAVALARIAARRAAGAASREREAAAAQRLIKAKTAAARESLKRKGSAPAPPSAKKSKSQSRRDALDLLLPMLDPSDDVVRLTLHVEAEMLPQHIYLSLATNWSPPDVLNVDNEVEIEVVPSAEWPAFSKSQESLERVLDETVVRSARKKLMENAADMRAGGQVDVDSECPVAAKVNMTGKDGSMRVSMATLVAMGDLHIAADRLQDFRCVVSWLKETAGMYNNRVPTFYGDKSSTIGDLGTDIMEVVLKSSPTTVVWRTDVQALDDPGEDSSLSASRLVANMGSTWMTDDFLTVNLTILRRWVKVNKPHSYALPCSFFVPLLLPPRGPAHTAAVTAAVNAAADEAFRLAGAVQQLAGACKINNSHWVAYAVHLPSTTVTQNDSGSHFAGLQANVSEALARVQAMGRRLRTLVDAATGAAQEKEGAPAGDVAASGDGGEGGEGAEDKSAAGGKKAWSQKKVRAPVQTDTTSCGAFAFSFTWHTLREENSKVQAGDAAAVRLEMVASAVRDGMIQEEELAARSARAAADAVMA